LGISSTSPFPLSGFAQKQQTGELGCPATRVPQKVGEPPKALEVAANSKNHLEQRANVQCFLGLL